MGPTIPSYRLVSERKKKVEIFRQELDESEKSYLMK